MFSFKPAIVTGAFSELEPEDSIKRLAGIGWRYFELCSVHMAKMDREILGVRAVVLHPLAERTGKENLEMVRGWLPLAERFGIRIAVENMHDLIPDVPSRRAFGVTSGRCHSGSKAHYPIHEGKWDKFHLVGTQRMGHCIE